VQNANQLASTVIHFFESPEQRQIIGLNAKQSVEKNRGALSEHLSMLEKLIAFDFRES